VLSPANQRAKQNGSSDVYELKFEEKAGLIEDAGDELDGEARQR
jgi:hypothetical protein